MLSACSADPGPAPLPNIPEYPGAEGLQSKDYPHFGTALRETQFGTDDTPEAVLTFYRKALTEANWKLETGEPGKGAKFSLTQGCVRSKLNIAVTRGEPVGAGVQLRLDANALDC